MKGLFKRITRPKRDAGHKSVDALEYEARRDDVYFKMNQDGVLLFAQGGDAEGKAVLGCSCSLH